MCSWDMEGHRCLRPCTLPDGTRFRRAGTNTCRSRHTLESLPLPEAAAGRAHGPAPRGRHTAAALLSRPRGPVFRMSHSLHQLTARCLPTFSHFSTAATLHVHPTGPRRFTSPGTYLHTNSSDQNRLEKGKTTTKKLFPGR